MVPKKRSEIPGDVCQSIERLMARLERDRESLVQSGYGEVANALALLNALADEADELKKAVQSPAEPSGVSE